MFHRRNPIPALSCLVYGGLEHICLPQQHRGRCPSVQGRRRGFQRGAPGGRARLGLHTRPPSGSGVRARPQGAPRTAGLVTCTPFPASPVGGGEGTVGGGPARGLTEAPTHLTTELAGRPGLWAGPLCMGRSGQEFQAEVRKPCMGPLLLLEEQSLCFPQSINDTPSPEPPFPVPDGWVLPLGWSSLGDGVQPACGVPEDPLPLLAALGPPASGRGEDWPPLPPMCYEYPGGAQRQSSPPARRRGYGRPRPWGLAEKGWPSGHK